MYNEWLEAHLSNVMPWKNPSLKENSSQQFYLSVQICMPTSQTPAILPPLWKPHTPGWQLQTPNIPTMVRVLLADMSKAFDRVDHAKLLQHRSDIEQCQRLLAGFHSYTTRRLQRVMASGTFSPGSEVTSGVPQGGKVSPLMFCLGHSPSEWHTHNPCLDCLKA